MKVVKGVEKGFVSEINCYPLPQGFNEILVAWITFLGQKTIMDHLIPLQRPMAIFRHLPIWKNQDFFFEWFHYQVASMVSVKEMLVLNFT
jgi:hypothetical protein